MFCSCCFVVVVLSSLCLLFDVVATCGLFVVTCYVLLSLTRHSLRWIQMTIPAKVENLMKYFHLALYYCKNDKTDSGYNNLKKVKNRLFLESIKRIRTYFKSCLK